MLTSVMGACKFHVQSSVNTEVRSNKTEGHVKYLHVYILEHTPVQSHSARENITLSVFADPFFLWLGGGDVEVL